eukprot:CAMPEP_0182818224 /NCGR_PEP_ID=MMETSP0006_2-20121128/11900_1 /TAXON_ID=97485 /ORGANISM="Prymnesium parvum, Strain Texoma1" /LENGTH=68 /DNA_ID=CAMNT_0024944655 /DNA_START=93 /DNA_END=295 /DNA_ORIENTATION=-
MPPQFHPTNVYPTLGPSPGYPMVESKSFWAVALTPPWVSSALHTPIDARAAIAHITTQDLRLPMPLPP